MENKFNDEEFLFDYEKLDKKVNDLEEEFNSYIYEVPCEWDKRRNCDSLYIEKYERLRDRVERAIELIEDNSKSLKTREYIDLDKGYVKILNEILRGDENE